MHDSEFAYGRNQYIELYSGFGFKSQFDHGGGLAIYIESGSSSFEACSITVYNCSMHKSTASVSEANMFLSINMPMDNKMTVHINNCKFYRGNSMHKSGGFMLQFDSNTKFADQTVYLANSEFYSNSAANGGGLGIHAKSEHPVAEVLNITVYNCSMYKNTVSVGANMLLSVEGRNIPCSCYVSW